MVGAKSSDDNGRPISETFDIRNAKLQRNNTAPKEDGMCRVSESQRPSG